MNHFAYIGGNLDRVSALRQDAAWIETQLAAAESRIIPFWRGHHWVEGDEPRLVIYQREQADEWLAKADEVVLLGVAEGRAIFGVELSNHEPLPGKWLDLRKIGGFLPTEEAAMAAYGRGLFYWHQHQQFCGRCGGPTTSHHGGHMRRCQAEGCGKQWFPRTDPAVIMLTVHQPTDGTPARCLLAQHTRSPNGMFSTLAGFVEPGESLEEAVIREVQEETGVQVERVSYQASQPWPFPASLMIGFRAYATSTTITIDPAELAEARWFTAAELRQTVEDSPTMRLAGRSSIARYLIESWLTEQG